LPADKARKKQRLMLRYTPGDPQFASVEELYNSANWGELNGLMMRSLELGAASVLAQLKAERAEASPDYERLQRALVRDLTRLDAPADPGAAAAPAKAFVPPPTPRAQPVGAVTAVTAAPASHGNAGTLVGMFPKKS
jgi:hypothetical protein